MPFKKLYPHLPIPIIVPHPSFPHMSRALHLLLPTQLVFAGLSCQLSHCLPIHPFLEHRIYHPPRVLHQGQQQGLDHLNRVQLSGSPTCARETTVPTPKIAVMILLRLSQGVPQGRKRGLVLVAEVRRNVFINVYRTYISCSR